MEGKFNRSGAGVDFGGGDMRHIAVLFAAVTMIGFGPFTVAQEADPTEEEIQREIDRQAADASFEEEITITGTLIPRPSLDSLSPVTVVDVAEELTLTGTTRIEDLIVSLPQVFAGQNSTIAA